VEESPEQVLARLARHRDSVHRARDVAIPGETRPPLPGSRPTGPRPAPPVPRPADPRPVRTAPPVGAWVSAQPTPTEFIPPGFHSSDLGWQLSQSPVLVTIFGLLLAVVASAAAVLSFEELSATAAFAVVGVMVLGGLAATAKRIPAALWWTVGALIGGALGRWS